MQVKTTHSNDALARHRQRLQEQAKQDAARSVDLKNEGTENLSQGTGKLDSAQDSRRQGGELADESDRLRRNGREQSARGLENLGKSSDHYSESFAKQEKGLADLQESFTSIQAASDTKGEALENITTGLGEQALANADQTVKTGQLAKNNAGNAALIEEKRASVSGLEQNVQARSESLNQQAEQVGDFILAGADYDAAKSVKGQGVEALGQGIEHRVKAETLDDAKSQQELQKTWADEDAVRHDKADKNLFFGSMYESLKAQAAKLNASFHEAAAQRGDAKASELASCAAQMKEQAAGLLQHARVLEHSGQHHLCIGQQMQCCPWTYCQGVALERQGRAEIAEAQVLKCQAQDMRAQAHEKSMEAEAARVKAEQAREVSQDLKVEGHGSEVRAEILSERADAHGQKADEARETSAESQAAAEQYAQKSAQEMEQARGFQQQGMEKVAQGLGQQTVALGTQKGSILGLNGAIETESGLQDEAKLSTDNVAKSLSGGRSFLSRSGSLLRSLHSSTENEALSQEKIQSGIEQFQSGIDQSTAATTKAQEAARLLSEARDLELEGLRLQNSGQRMLLEARPKMADAAKLSAQSFEAYNTADRSETEGERLIQQGNEKIAASVILKQKAQSYQNLAEAG